MIRTNPVSTPRSLTRARFNLTLAVVLDAILLTSVVLLAVRGDFEAGTVISSLLTLLVLSGFTTRAVTGLRTVQHEHRHAGQG